MCKFHSRAALAFVAAMAAGHWAAAETLGIGRTPSEAEIAGWNIDVRYDGAGLPPGAGDVTTGETLFEEACASCHGDFGQGEGRWPALSGGFDSLSLQGAAGRPEKTVGSYWPYAPTLFDYIRRAMPYAAPQSLSADETYALSAFILYLNDIVGDDFVADARSLAAVKMPNRDNFYDDPRPDAQNTACMKNCLNAEEMKLLESIRGVTPTQDAPDSAHAQVAEDEAAAENTDAAAEAVYARACAVCHDSGVAEAPIASPAGAADWQARLKAGGYEGMIESAWNGKGAMPPQKSAGLSREEVAAAVRRMLQAAKVDF